MKGKLTLLFAALAVALCTMAADTGEQRPEQEPTQEVTAVTVSDPANQLEFRLPAPYWVYYDRTKLAGQAQGGCSGRSLPPNLIFVCGHKDAPAEMWCLRGTDPFLMRDKRDLEAFIQAFHNAVSAQVGESMAGAESSYEERDGIILHRLAFTARPSSARSGCAAPQAAGPGAGEQEPTAYLFVDYFVRPKGGDALHFRTIGRAPASVFEALRAEIEFIVSSLRYTGGVAEEFFVPDAPPEKVPGPKEAARTAGGKRGNYGFIVAAGLVLAIWFMMRRRKKTAA